MAVYNPKVIQKLADKLYHKAHFIIFGWTIFGVMLGILAGRIFAVKFSLDFDVQANLVIMAVGGFIVGAIGLAIGISRSFMIRLHAQLALCYKQIEENTRQVSISTMAWRNS